MLKHVEVLRPRFKVSRGRVGCNGWKGGEWRTLREAFKMLRKAIREQSDVLRWLTSRPYMPGRVVGKPGLLFWG